MGKWVRKLLWNQWEQIRGDFKWSIIEHLRKHFWYYVSAGSASLVAIVVAFWNWAEELSGPWLFLLFFGFYAFSLGIIAGVLTIAVKVKQLLAKDSPTPIALPPAEFSPLRFNIELIEKELCWRAEGESDFHPILPGHPIAKDAILSLRVVAKITANPAQRVHDILLEVEHYGQLWPHDMWQPQDIFAPQGLPSDFYFDVRPPLQPSPYRMKLFARVQVDETPVGPNFTEHRSQSFDVRLSQVSDKP